MFDFNLSAQRSGHSFFVHTFAKRLRGSSALPWLASTVLAVGLWGCATPTSQTNAQADAQQRASLRLALASGYFEQGQFAVALEEASLALKLDAQSVDALNLQGLAHMRLNHPQAAQRSFEQALAIKPDDADTLHNLAWLRCQQAHYAQAQRGFERALAQKAYPRAARTWTSLGLCQIRAGEHAQATQSLLQADALMPGQPVVMYNLAWVLWRQGQMTQAQSYTRALNNSPQANAESLWLGVRVERSLNNLDSMAQLAAQLKKRFALSPEMNAYERGAFDE
jgi:type IV pilus assembly protein PilF